MKICVIIPSEEYRKQAGARIRYLRMLPALRQLGHELVLQPVGDLNALEMDAEVYLLSKVNDAQAMVYATVLRARGKAVGIDLFDDYFSQATDSRFVRFRNWLAAILPKIDFVLCSTSAMADIAHGYRGDIPVHLMNDPGESWTRDTLVAGLGRKLAQAQDCREVRLTWFGMGDNPHFRVGLSDLASCAPILAQIRNSGWQIRLRVLTNERALTADGLAILRHLPVPFELELWSEERELQLLDESLACLLPVNAQNFSVAKSLNRAMTTLSSACQVVSPGFPLYEPLDALIYRDTAQFLGDLSSGLLRLREETVPVFGGMVEEFASAEVEAAKLTAFLKGFPSAPAAGNAPFAVVHGAVTRGDIHKLARRMGGFSVASPFCAANLGFDVRFHFGDESAALFCLVNEKLLDRIEPTCRETASKHGRIGDQTYWAVAPAGLPQTSQSMKPLPLPMQLSRYRRTMEAIRVELRTMFGDLDVWISEMSPLPFEVGEPRYHQSSLQ